MKKKIGILLIWIFLIGTITELNNMKKLGVEANTYDFGVSGFEGWGSLTTCGDGTYFYRINLDTSNYILEYALISTFDGSWTTAKSIASTIGTGSPDQGTIRVMSNGDVYWAVKIFDGTSTYTLKGYKHVFGASITTWTEVYSYSSSSSRIILDVFELNSIFYISTYAIGSGVSFYDIGLTYSPTILVTTIFAGSGYIKDGHYYMVLTTSTGTHIYKLDGTAHTTSLDETVSSIQYIGDYKPILFQKNGIRMILSYDVGVNGYYLRKYADGWNVFSFTTPRRANILFKDETYDPYFLYIEYTTPLSHQFYFINEKGFLIKLDSDITSTTIEQGWGDYLGNGKIVIEDNTNYNYGNVKQKERLSPRTCNFNHVGIDIEKARVLYYITIRKI